jgi:hypothetical protein
LLKGPVFAGGMPVRAKLTIGEPDDQYEQEADRVAEQVMSIPDPVAQSPVQRAAADDIQTKSGLQRSTDGGLQADGSIEEQLSSAQMGGSPLSDDVRSFMELRFGADFSRVRIHTGSDSVDMNRGLQAQAFTHGSHIYYGEGKVPGKNDLTAHELTHVVQQTETAPCHSGLEVSSSRVENTLSRSSDDERPFWESQAFGTATDILGYVPGIGTATSIMTHPFDIVNALTSVQRGNYVDATLTAGKLGTLGAGIAAELGGFSLGSAALGTSVGSGMLPTLSGLAAAGTAGGSTAAGGAAAALGPAAAVAGAGLAGVGLGRLMDEGVGSFMNWTGASETLDSTRGISRPEGQHGDYSISGGIGLGLTAIDQAITGDDYRDNWGYRLASWLDE